MEGFLGVRVHDPVAFARNELKGERMALKAFASPDNKTFTHELPANLGEMATATGTTLQALWAAFAQFGVPIVIAVLTAVFTGNWAGVWVVVGQDGSPLVAAVLAALGINIPVPTPAGP